MKNKKYCIANWKMNFNNNNSINFINKFNEFDIDESNVTIIVCPSFTSLSDMNKLNKNNNFKLGSQNVSIYEKGSYTGEISIDMINDFNCKYSIIGHSERRKYCNEDNNIISQKFDLLHKSNIIPIVCIGETLSQRNDNSAFKVIEEQLTTLLKNKNINISKEIIIAYEPVWAIGTGLSADIDTIRTMHLHIKNSIEKIIPNNCNIHMLYGGSVNENNAADIIKVDYVDGFLIGSSSLEPEKFYKIYKTLKEN